MSIAWRPKQASESPSRKLILTAFGICSVLGFGLGLAACTSPTARSASKAHSSSTRSQPPRSSTSLPLSTPSPSSPGAMAKRVPLQGPDFGEFYSPSRNISCEMNTAPQAGGNFADGSPIAPYVMCMSLNPAQSATLLTDGSVMDCLGIKCLSNAGIDTPILPYGSETGAGPFLCSSSTEAMTCKNLSGKGFSISSSGLSHLG